MKNSSLTNPEIIPDDRYRYDSFTKKGVLFGKKKGKLPAMGWNSWNAFGSSNTEKLTLEMARCIKTLGLDKLGYSYLVLDDGCYLNERVEGRLSNDPVKFPGGFKYLADRLHEMGLKFGMYNDIGTNLCAGAAVGTCGHEKEDAESYAAWDVDFLKVDNCYYLWDDATFSDKTNAKYVYAPAISKIRLTHEAGGMITLEKNYLTGENISVNGAGVIVESIDGKPYFTNIGTYDGTGPKYSPVEDRSGELVIEFDAPYDAVYMMDITFVSGEETGRGSWLQIAAEADGEITCIMDGMPGEEGSYIDPKKNREPSDPSGERILTVPVSLKPGHYKIRFMNHRRQENTLMSYAKLLEGLKHVIPDKEIVYSLCEWGKTQPQDWGWKVADSWRILNDITFNVGNDGDPGKAEWTSEYTNSITSQYNKAVIMDEFSGLDKGWNDPDMMVIGMNGLNMVQNRTHMAMWCMMNSPLMLGLDLRRITKDDELYRVIANSDLIALNQDALGVQAKRIYTSILGDDERGLRSDREYITNNDRVDILAKPLSDGSVALSFINVSDNEKHVECRVSAEDIAERLKKRFPEADRFASASSYRIKDLWTKEERINADGIFPIGTIGAFDNVTIRIIPEQDQ